MTGSLCLIIRQRCIVPDNFGEKTLLAIYCYLLFDRIRWILIPGIDYRRLTMFTSDNSENTNTESGKKNFIQFYDFSEKKKKKKN